MLSSETYAYYRFRRAAAAPSARSFVACTIGVQGVLRSAYPLDEQLCDEYIFTEVVVDDSGFWSRTSNEAFKLFKAVASERRRSNSQEERFCLSLYDNFVAHDMAFPAVAFSANAVDMYTNSGISCYGLLNQVHSISALAGLDVLRQSLTLLPDTCLSRFARPIPPPGPPAPLSSQSAFNPVSHGLGFLRSSTVIIATTP
ncbi:uncharacterized protein LOC125945799 [Dermacentor silvarum]|uniref:uncharacterized protein LOC125945799 n=1 Tax=Dermacentor silvarum TaxID=543639 RepID=UPI0021013AB1|nr:uncharacterized protein LOC125945799 [Dermacentor silvarum]